MRSVVALSAEKSTSPGCCRRRGRKCRLFRPGPQSNRRVSVLFLSEALV